MNKKDGRKRDISRCCCCGVLKTPKNTGKNKDVRNGLKSKCNACTSAYNREYRKQHKNVKEKMLHQSNQGIDSTNQVDSVLREMAELQHQINTENGLCEKRKKMIEDYTEELIEPLVVHQHKLRGMLNAFIKKAWHGSKRKAGHYRFGSIRLHRGKLIVDLKPELAGRFRGKP